MYSIGEYAFQLWIWKPIPMEKVLSDIFALFYANNPDNQE